MPLVSEIPLLKLQSTPCLPPLMPPPQLRLLMPVQILVLPSSRSMSGEIDHQQVEELTKLAWEASNHDRFSELLQICSLETLNGYNSRGQTALYCACRAGNLTSVVAMLSVPGIDVNKGENIRQSTPLHAAAWNEQEVITAMLLWMGADPCKLNHFKLSAKDEARGGPLFRVFPLVESEGISALTKAYPQLLQLRTREEKKTIFSFLERTQKKGSRATAPNTSRGKGGKDEDETKLKATVLLDLPEKIPVASWFEFLVGCDETVFAQKRDLFIEDEGEGFLSLKHETSGRKIKAGRFSVLNLGEMIDVVSSHKGERKFPKGYLPPIEIVTADRYMIRYVDVAFLQTQRVLVLKKTVMLFFKLLLILMVLRAFRKHPHPTIPDLPQNISLIEHRDRVPAYQRGEEP
eukprot:TRINITY_DN7874_c0_g1_i7.p1 TRINITY_DN7874_c0_g1~~TRINITY_DN7874_c0_g1_i7.p1  ORF type:complete len:405 (-),score=82.66 TRINITY_DN7874_c0_g1_i7:760-1974(-)